MFDMANLVENWRMSQVCKWKCYVTSLQIKSQPTGGDKLASFWNSGPKFKKQITPTSAQDEFPDGPPTYIKKRRKDECPAGNGVDFIWAPCLPVPRSTADFQLPLRGTHTFCGTLRRRATHLSDFLFGLGKNTDGDCMWNALESK